MLSFLGRSWMCLLFLVVVVVSYCFVFIFNFVFRVVICCVDKCYFGPTIIIRHVLQLVHTHTHTHANILVCMYDIVCVDMCLCQIIFVLVCMSTYQLIEYTPKDSDDAIFHIHKQYTKIHLPSAYPILRTHKIRWNSIFNALAELTVNRLVIYF